MAGVDLVRGMADIPLTPIGIAEAHHLGARIKAKGGIHSVGSSPLYRARQTAAAVLQNNPEARMLGVSKGLLPWASGEFEGAPIHMVQSEMHHYMRNPKVPMPGVSKFSGIPGESMDQYWKNRLAPHFIKRLSGLDPVKGKSLDVTHYRDIEFLRSWLKNGAKPDMSLDMHDLMHGGVNRDKPATLFRVSLKPPRLEPIDLASNKQLEPGYYVARHGATSWSAEGNTGEGLQPLKMTGEGRNIIHKMGLMRLT